MLKERIRNGIRELIDTRTGAVVVRSPVDTSKVESTVDRYSRAVESRSLKAAKQHHWNSKVIPSLWSLPVNY